MYSEIISRMTDDMFLSNDKPEGLKRSPKRANIYVCLCGIDANLNFKASCHYTFNENFIDQSEV
jgi:hypothetical protein